jgi:predicted ester cyclase
MATREDVSKIRRALEEVMNNGNVDALDQIDDPGVVFHMYPFPDIKGREGVKQMFRAFGSSFSGTHAVFEEMISEGDLIAGRYTAQMKHTGVNPMFPVPPTGKEVTLTGCFFTRLKDGRSIEVFEYDDMLGFMQHLGVIPPAGPA